MWIYGRPKDGCTCLLLSRFLVFYVFIYFERFFVMKTLIINQNSIVVISGGKGTVFRGQFLPRTFTLYPAWLWLEVGLVG